MNSTTLTRLMLGFSAAALATACGSSQSGSDSTVVQTLNVSSSFQKTQASTFMNRLIGLALPGVLAEPTTLPPIVDSKNTTLFLTEAWVHVTKIQFHTADEPNADSEDAELEDDGDTVTFKGTYKLNLLSTDPIPITTDEMPVKPYTKIRFKMHKNGPKGESVKLAGQYGGVGFSYTGRDTTYLVIGGPEAVWPDSQSELLVEFRIADMFSKIDLSSLTSDTDISFENRVPVENACPSIFPQAHDLYTCFRKALDKQASFSRIARRAR